MRRMILQGLVLAFLVTLFPALSMKAAAQEASSEKSEKEGKVAAVAKPVAVYRVDFTMREMEDGKVLNTRKYMLMTDSQGWAKSRVGSRVPISTGNEVTYQDVGINIDCRVRDRDDAILLDTSIESSSVVPPEQAPGSSALRPVFRRVSSNVTGAVALGKPTIIGSMDDVTSSHRFEIEATVTQVK